MKGVDRLFKGVLVLLFYPFSILYGCVMVMRTACYNGGLFKREKTPVFSIGIGNITVGGTGKTPHIEYLIKIYEKNKAIVTLSRGYGRKSKGFLVADSLSDPLVIGDEPWQFFMKFGNRIKVAVGEKRAYAAKRLHDLYPEVDLLLMDDVFQHHAVQADFSILLCDYNNPFFKDFPFPAGRLREFRSGAQRADFIIVSKCPSVLSENEKQNYRKKLSKHAAGIPLAFSAISYDEPIPVFKTQQPVPNKWMLVTGIANAAPLVNYLKDRQLLIGHLEFSDHHIFSIKEAEDILKAYQSLGDKRAGVLMTEKDYARLSSDIKVLWKELPLFYIPIAVRFLEGEELLLENIAQAMQTRAQLFD